MVRRKAWNWKRYAYLGFAFMVLLACWEANRSNALVYAASNSAAGVSDVIPQESIRLRILAHSDAPQDQWIKREIRDVIVEEMNGWATEPKSIEEAREIIRERLPELEALVGRTLQEYGFDYTYQVELGIVPFPTKMYGNEVYPAGDYEALRVTIGDGKGQNWWCVLFPPLCFVDSEMIAKKKPNTAHAAAAGDEANPQAASAEGSKNSAGAETESLSAKKDRADEKAEAGREGLAQAQGVDAANDGEASANQTPQPEIRFFLWDLFKKIGSLFA